MPLVYGFAVELVVHLLSLFVTGWVLYQSWQCAQFVKGKTNRRSNSSSSSSSPRKSSVTRRPEKNGFLVNLTLFEHCLYFVICLVSTSTVIQLLIRAVRHPHRDLFDFPRGSSIEIGTVMTYALYSPALVLISLISFSRLRIVFETTQFSISSKTTLMIHSWIAIYLIISIIPHLTFAFMGVTMISTMILVFSELINLVLCVSINGWIIRKFIQFSLAIERAAQGITEPRTMFPRINSLSMINDRSNSGNVNGGWTEKLSHTSLRITLSCLIPLVSSVLASLMVVIGASLSSKPLWFAARCLFAMDWCLNSFGILCTYQMAIPYYDLVFGCLDRWIYRMVCQRR